MYIGQYLYTIKSTEGSTNLPTPIVLLFNFYCEILRWINPSTHPLNRPTGNSDTHIQIMFISPIYDRRHTTDDREFFSLCMPPIHTLIISVHQLHTNELSQFPC